MKRFWLAHKGLHFWLAGNVVFLCLFWLVRGNRAWMNALADRVTGPVKQALGRLWAPVPFSVMELLIVLLVLGGVAWLIVCVVLAVRKGRKAFYLYRCFLVFLCGGLSLYGGACLLWGVNYYTDSFQDRSGIYAQEVALEELQTVTQYFAQRLAETADGVARTESGGFAVPQADLFAAAPNAYDQLAQVYPFLAFPDTVPKQIFFSRIMSQMSFTGVFCPFTGESNLNVDSPSSLLPATIAHELAHQRGVASEQECNFIAILASTTCGDPAYAYSGWLLGYIHLSNALYSADQAAWQTVWDSLPEPVQVDLHHNNAYWKQFEGVTSQASQKVYDTFLKSYGESRGIQSYGTVVDLLVAYYKELPV